MYETDFHRCTIIPEERGFFYYFFPEIFGVYYIFICFLGKGHIEYYLIDCGGLTSTSRPLVDAACTIFLYERTSSDRRSDRKVHIITRYYYMMLGATYFFIESWPVLLVTGVAAPLLCLQDPQRGEVLLMIIKVMMQHARTQHASIYLSMSHARVDHRSIINTQRQQAVTINSSINSSIIRNLLLGVYSA